MSDLWEPCQFNDESHVYCEPPSELGAIYDDLLLKVTGNMLVGQKIEVAKMVCEQLNENAALREQLAAKDEALRQAAMLALIASDWHLEEIEIDGEIVLTYDLHKRFMQALEGSSATGEDE